MPRYLIRMKNFPNEPIEAENQEQAWDYFKLKHPAARQQNMEAVHHSLPDLRPVITEIGVHSGPTVDVETPPADLPKP